MKKVENIILLIVLCLWLGFKWYPVGSIKPGSMSVSPLIYTELTEDFNLQTDVQEDVILNKDLSDISESSLSMTKNEVLYDPIALKWVTIDQLNTYAQEDWTHFKGIGPVLGQRIVDYIILNGPITHIEELMNVKGIGEVTLEKILSSGPR